MKTFVSDPELRNYYESMLQEEAGQLMSDLYEEGKKEGYINSELSKEAFLIFVELLRQGIYHYNELPDRLEKNPKLARELITISPMDLTDKHCISQLNGRPTGLFPF